MQKKDAYQVITDRICELLEKGEIPWQRPWNSGNDFPKNLASKKEYRGINPFMLASMRYTSPYWLTFKQAKDLGGGIKAGEKGTPVVFWKWIEREDESTGEVNKIPFLRYYTVFNLTQTVGIPEDKIPALDEETREFNPIEEAEKIVANMQRRPEIQNIESRAYYRPSQDLVNMPKKELFKSDEEYYSTLFHELTHSTGHENRLNRKGIGELQGFGSHSYSKEELCAEFGSAFLCGESGIVERVIENSAGYIQGWLKRLRSDKKFLVQAASQGQKAADFILNKNREVGVV
ncbi:hypothetical protein CEE37_05915 [candidate division LCP-89 bacterium B3_LCP]|uniref:Antirestriction protein n=1 Tax=candidate division LCP-89 bacterium B3_LCP TaxID=2012998 RepID=A0A532V230_UNCL8|nr:MAG: hypothetical protein CEE37_05915 [candidate division LCP-89 bacterium B3_LCP]